MADSGRILIVDDERGLCEFLQIFLTKEGYDVETSFSGRRAIERIAGGEEFDLVLTDLKMPEVSGIEVLEAVKEHAHDTQVLMMTAYATADTAVKAMKIGAYDYIQKPFKVEEIRIVVDKGLEKRRLLQENRELRAQIHRQYSFSNIIGQSGSMQRVFDVIRRVANTRTSVLVTGESGTGKELIARAIHHNSSRQDFPLVTVNCGAIPENLMESELFGHMKGAFTGAHSNKVGMFTAADTGSIFLDEIGELPMHLQVKLLRALQERRIRPVGSTEEKAVDVRVIAATNQDLEAAVKEGRFREDLYYRLNVIRVEVPALRERREDVPLIARHFLTRFANDMGKRIKDFDPEAMRAILRHTFPGNVRELENLVERAVTFETSDRVTLDSLPPRVVGKVAEMPPVMGPEVPAEGLDLEETLAEFEKQILRQALKRTSGVRTEAARLLKITFRSMRYKLLKYGIGVEESDGA